MGGDILAAVIVTGLGLCHYDYEMPHDSRGMSVCIMRMPKLLLPHDPGSVLQPCVLSIIRMMELDDIFFFPQSLTL